LTVEKMVAAGVDRRTAQRAFDRAHGHDAEALAEAHRRAQEEAIVAKAEAKRQAKEAARQRLTEREAKVEVRPRKPEVAPAEAGSARVLADYLRKGKVKISKIEEMVAGRFGAINAEAEAARLKAVEQARPKPEPAAPKAPVPGSIRSDDGTVDEARLRDLIRDRTAGLTRPSQINYAVYNLLHEQGFNAGPTVRARSHDMAHEEEFRATTIGGMKVHYPPLPEEFDPINLHPLVPMMRTVWGTGEPLPEGLTRQTRNLYLSTQVNDKEEYWTKVNKTPGEVAAMAGQGTVVVYRGRPLGRDLLAHEMGHNLAAAHWQGITPPPGSKYHRAIASGEPPVSDYGRVNHAEDFAEAVRLFATDPGGLKGIAPMRHAAIEALIGAGKGGEARRAPHPAPKAAPTIVPTPAEPELGFRTGLGRAFSEARPDVSVTDAAKGQMTEYADRHFGAWAKSLSDKEVSAFGSYAKDGYKQINGQLRKDKLSPQIRGRVEMLDAAIGKAEAPEDLLLFRGVKDFEKVTGVKLADAEGLEGTTIRDKGYMSMSMNRDQATWFMDSRKGTYLAIAVPKGAQVAALDPLRRWVDSIKGNQEAEVLAARGSGLKITQVVRATKGRTYIYAELVPPED
jgi:hypothetical protein